MVSRTIHVRGPLGARTLHTYLAKVDRHRRNMAAQIVFRGPGGARTHHNRLAKPARLQADHASPNVCRLTKEPRFSVPGPGFSSSKAIKKRLSPGQAIFGIACEMTAGIAGCQAFIREIC